ncbi:MAG: alpha/beta fold hydrolase [Fibrobacterota bacterium]|nr:alpha/beta fold hydrolase [Fibrobacterota bacterium]
MSVSAPAWSSADNVGLQSTARLLFLSLAWSIPFAVSLAVAGQPAHSVPSGVAAPAFTLEKFPSAPEGRFDSTLLDPLATYIRMRPDGISGWAETGIFTSPEKDGLPQVHHVPAPGAKGRRLTFFPKRMSGFHFNPQPFRKNFLFTQDDGGNEQYRVGLYDLRTGESRVMGAPPGRVEGLIWNDSGTAFAYAHTPVGTDRWDIRMGRPDGSDTLLFNAPGTWIPMDIRPDGKKLLLQKYVSASKSGIYILDLRKGGIAQLGKRSPSEDPPLVASADHAFWVRTPYWSYLTRTDIARDIPPERDTTWSVGFTSDLNGVRQRLYLLAADWVRSGTDGDTDSFQDEPQAWSHETESEVEWGAVGPDRRTVIYSVNKDGYSRLHSAGTGRTKRSRERKGIPEGVIGGIQFRPGAKSTEFGFTLNGPAYPGEAYSYNLRTDRATRWTKSGTGGLSPSRFSTPTLVRYPTFDSLAIPAWLHLPNPAHFPGPRPVLILVHGGPEQQARPVFDPFVQYAVGTLGLAVVRPNVRGSSGYGRAWLNADDGMLRMNSVRDLGALLDWIGTRRELDPSRIAVSGRSYGGFMSLSALIEYGDRLKAGISSVGISHFPTFLQKTSGYRRDLRRAEYGDERDPRMARFLDSISPLTRMDRIASPLLLTHGRNDPRVPYGESERIFAALKGRKVPVWFMTFGDEGHSVKDQDTQLAQWRVMSRFLKQHLETPRR